MNYKTVYSNNQNVDKAVNEIAESLADFRFELLLFFASSNFNPAEISLSFARKFPDIDSFGCSTSGEIKDGELVKGSIVALAFGPEVFNDYKIAVIEDLNNTQKLIPDTFKAFEDHFGLSANDMDHQEYFGMVLVDGMSGKEELVNEKIGELTNIVFIGGSAGDDLKFHKTYIYANGSHYANAALVGIFKPRVKYDFIKTQSFNLSESRLVPTKVDEPNRVVIEFNGKPAAEAYAEALNVSVEELPGQFSSHPLGLVAMNNEPFVRSPQKLDGTKIHFYCQIKEGMELSILNATNIIEDTRKVIEEKLQEMNGISAIINFNCILRTLEIEQKQLNEKHKAVFSDIPNIGFSTYGESFIGHINQTATMIVFKD